MTQQPLQRWIPEDTFGDRLRRVRRELKLSQAEFAEKIGEGAKAVGAWEIGIREPRGAVALAKRIELAYGVPAAWLLGLDVEPTPGPDGPDATPLPSGVSKRYALRPLEAVAA